MASVLEAVLLYVLAYFFRVLDYIKIWRTSKSRTIRMDNVLVEHIQIPSRDAGRTISAIRYSPKGFEGPLPVHLNWHASGWVLKRLGLDRHMCVRFAQELRCVVLDCDYRKAPEHKFPAAHNDTEDAVLYVLANPSLYDTKRITVGGSSAGGSMALSISAHLGPERIRGCFSLYPVTYITELERTKKTLIAPNPRFRSGIVIPDLVIKFFIRAYVGSDMSQINEPRLSPLYYDESRFPKHVFIACGDADSLYPNACKMLDKLHHHVGSELRSTRKMISIPQEAHEFNNFPEVDISYEWRHKVEDTAMGMIRASWQD